MDEDTKKAIPNDTKAILNTMGIVLIVGGFTVAHGFLLVFLGACAHVISMVSWD